MVQISSTLLLLTLNPSLVLHNKHAFLIKTAVQHTRPENRLYVALFSAGFSEMSKQPLRHLREFHAVVANIYAILEEARHNEDPDLVMHDARVIIDGWTPGIGQWPGLEKVILAAEGYQSALIF